MPPRSLLVFGMLFVGAVCCAQGQTNDLKKYASAEGKFEILLPGTPKAKKTGEATTVSWEKDGQGLAVTFGHLPVIADKNPANRDKLLAAMADEAAKSLKAEIGQRKKLDLLGNPGIEWTGTAKDGEAIVRTYLVGQRFYQIIAIGKSDFLKSETVQKSFNSFKLTK